MSEYRFAERMGRVSGESEKEILAMMSNPDMISFGGGRPSAEAFPVAFIKEAAQKILDENPVPILSYGQTEGYRPLREAYLKYMVQAKGIEAGIENVIMGSGGTQGIDLVTQAFLDEGDVVLVESPTYLSVLNVLYKLGARLVAVETDENGMIMEDLEAKMKEYAPKMLYCIPTFQNPTGCTLPADRRKRIAELAEQYDVIVIEDDPYCALRYSGEALPPIKSFDRSGHVVLLDSFSKIVSPGFRVGGVVADEEIIDKMVLAKQCADTHSTLLTQAICAEFLNRNMLQDHIRSVIPIYKEHLDRMIDGMRKHFPETCRYQVPDGGLFVWVELPENIDSRELLRRCAARNVGFVPGCPFFLDPEDGVHRMRMNFSSQSLENIDKGIEIIGEEIRNY